MKKLLEQMSQRVLARTNGILKETAVPRLAIGVLRQHGVPAVMSGGPGVCLVLQGAKQMIIGNKMLRYGAGSCFTSLIELPSTRCIFELEDGKPYVAASLSIDHAAVMALLAELPPSLPTEAVAGFSVAAASREALQAWDSYLALLDTPDDVPVLAALRERELLYRLLQSPHGLLLRQIARQDSRLARVRRAIDWMRDHYHEPMSVETLAETARMSVPSFNRHFKAATATSPLQYQKTLRLQAARRLLVANSEAAHTAYAVGYESASQFSREYARLFGLPPKQDAVFLRENIGMASMALI
jgi:AraC-like DNA-binding protein